MRESRRVRALTSKLFWNIGPAWAGQGDPRLGQGGQPEKPNNSNAGQGGQGGRGIKIVWAEETGRGLHFLPEGRRFSSRFSRTDLTFNPDHPDHSDPASSANGLAGQGALKKGGSTPSTLTKTACRRCGGPIEDQRPNWLPFADGSFAHEACEMGATEVPA